jgi:hypothetical protein
MLNADDMLTCGFAHDPIFFHSGISAFFESAFFAALQTRHKKFFPLIFIKMAWLREQELTVSMYVCKIHVGMKLHTNE